MTNPYRGSTGTGTYFITASAYEKQNLLQANRMAGLLIEVLYHYRKQQKYILHEYVVMPNHFHLLITPVFPVSLEKALQYIKGGFSHRARKELGFLGQIWQTICSNPTLRSHEPGQARTGGDTRGF
jgi:REP-associated tyrosine transposase